MELGTKVTKYSAINPALQGTMKEKSARYLYALGTWQHPVPIVPNFIRD